MFDCCDTRICGSFWDLLTDGPGGSILAREMEIAGFDDRKVKLFELAELIRQARKLLHEAQAVGAGAD